MSQLQEVLSEQNRKALREKLGRRPTSQELVEFWRHAPKALKLEFGDRSKNGDHREGGTRT
jgi:hypothetical protein